MRFLVFVLSLLIHHTAFAQDFLWANRLGSTEADRSKSIALDAMNNIYTVGTFRNTIVLDTNIRNYYLNAQGGNDILIQKLDTDGNFLWARSIGGIGGDDGTAICTDKNGAIYITGSFRDTVDFDPSNHTMNLIAQGSADIFLLKLDYNGNFLWVKQMGGAGFDEGNALTTDALGNIYVAGRFRDTVDFDPNAGILTYATTSSSSSFVQKLDTHGNLIWAKAILGNGNNEIFSIALDSAHNVYTTGDFSGIIDLDPSTNTLLFGSTGANDIFIQKLDAHGNLVWGKKMGGIGRDAGHSITVAPNGMVYSVGRFSNVVDFNTGAGVMNISSNGAHDVYIHKLTAHGDFVWAKGMGGNSFDDARDITTDQNGDIYLIGYFTDVVDFDLGTGSAPLTSKGYYDAFIQKIDAHANLLWVKTIGGTESDLGRGIALDDNKNVYFTGYFKNTINLDQSQGTLSLTSIGNYDNLTGKLSNCALDTTITIQGYTLTANEANAQYQWVDCTSNTPIANATNASFVATTNGSYKVIISKDGCTSHSSCWAVSMVAVENLPNPMIRLFPNPTTEQIIIQTSNPLEATISILDIHGKMMLPPKKITTNTALSMQPIPSGVYYVFIQIDKQQKVIKLVKQ